MKGLVYEMLVRHNYFVPSLLLTVLCLVGCAGDGEGMRRAPALDPSAVDKIPVVATYSILGDWVQRVGGDRVSVTTLVGVDGDPHTYEPTPQDSVLLSKAFIIFENGLEFEGWLEGLCSSSQTRAIRVVAARNVTPREQRCACHGTERDPHVWHSIKHAISMVGVIGEELANFDQAHAQEHRARAAAYIRELEALDTEIRQQVELIPADSRRLVTAHDSFGYFAQDYGFQAVSLLDSFTSEAADPSAMRLASVVRQVKEQKVPVIFSENTLSNKLAETVAREAGVKFVTTLYTDALGPEDSPASDYVGMMRHNAKTIAESLIQ
jgi:zinc/manganese transport system substrate-binding protein